MKASTTIHMRDGFGTMLAIIKDWHRLEYYRRENQVGYLYLDLDPSQVDAGLFYTLKDGYRFEVWRQVGGNTPYLDGETVFFLEKWGYKIDSSGKEVFHIECADANVIWKRTIVAYPDGHGKAEFGPNYADTSLKVLCEENRGTACDDTTRNCSAYLAQEADRNEGPMLYKKYSYENVLDCMQEICADSLEAGTYLVFDTVWTSPTMLEFRTYIRQRGRNHGSDSQDIVTISRERKNLEEPEYMEDHSEESNFIYAGGEGVGSARVIATAQLSVAVNASPFSRRERFVAAVNTGDSNYTQAEANAALVMYKAKKSLTGRIVDTEGCMDGVHYRYGDIVYAEYRGMGFDAHIDTLHVTIQNGKEYRENIIRSEGLVPRLIAWS